MNLLRYKDLQDKEHTLIQEYSKFIIDAIKVSGGKISFIYEENFEEDSPMIITLQGKNGPDNIDVTDIYIREYDHGVVEIYADGIDQEWSGKETGFLILPENYSDIAHLIMLPIIKQIDCFAQKLAMKELAEKYNKLPCVFMNITGIIIPEYHSEYRELVSNHSKAIELLLKKTNEAKSEKQLEEIHSLIMELTDDISAFELIQAEKKLDEEMMFEQDGCLYYKEEYQNKYNAINESIEAELNTFFGFEID